MTDIQLENCDMTELKDLRAQIDARMLALKEDNVRQLRMRFTNEAADAGLTVDDVMSIEKKRRGRKPKTTLSESTT